MSWSEYGQLIAMKTHFRWCSLLNRCFPLIRIDSFSFWVSPTTCKPLRDECGLTAQVKSGQNVLDLGTGSGIIGISAAKRGALVVASDISPAAIADTQRNAKLNDAEPSITTVLSDGYLAVSGQFDWIFSHLPYVELCLSKDRDSQWAAAPYAFAEKTICGAAARLQPAGLLVLLWPARKVNRVKSLAESSGLRLKSQTPWHPRSLRLFIWRLLYLDIGFRSTVYILAPVEP